MICQKYYVTRALNGDNRTSDYVQLRTMSQPWGFQKAHMPLALHGVSVMVLLRGRFFFFIDWSENIKACFFHHALPHVAEEESRNLEFECIQNKLMIDAVEIHKSTPIS